MTSSAIARVRGTARSTVGLIPIIRYKRGTPGEMIHLDIKKLGMLDVEGRCVTGDRLL